MKRIKTSSERGKSRKANQAREFSRIHKTLSEAIKLSLTGDLKRARTLIRQASKEIASLDRQLSGEVKR